MKQKTQRKTKAIIEINKKCNYHCVFCNVPKNGPNISFSRFKQIIDNKRPWDYLGISGGNPDFHPQAEDITYYALSALKEKGELVFSTNLSIERKWFLSIKDNRFVIQVNLPSLQEKIYNKITGTVGNLTNVIKNIEKLIEADKIVVVHAVFTKFNFSLKALMDFVNFAKRYDNKLILSFTPMFALTQDMMGLYPDAREWDKTILNFKINVKIGDIHVPIYLTDKTQMKKLINGTANTIDYITVDGKVYKSLFHAYVQ